MLSIWSWDISDHLRIYLLTSAMKHHLWNPLSFILFLFRLISVFRIESFQVLCSPRYRGKVLTFLRVDIIFLPPFSAPSPYFIYLPPCYPFLLTWVLPLLPLSDLRPRSILVESPMLLLLPSLPLCLLVSLFDLSLNSLMYSFSLSYYFLVFNNHGDILGWFWR